MSHWYRDGKDRTGFVMAVSPNWRVQRQYNYNNATPSLSAIEPPSIQAVHREIQQVARVIDTLSFADLRITQRVAV